MTSAEQYTIEMARNCSGAPLTPILLHCVLRRLLDIRLPRRCQENCSERTDSILMCGFDTVL